MTFFFLTYFWFLPQSILPQLTTEIYIPVYIKKNRFMTLRKKYLRKMLILSPTTNSETYYWNSFKIKKWAELKIYEKLTLHSDRWKNWDKNSLLIYRWEGFFFCIGKGCFNQNYFFKERLVLEEILLHHAWF